MRILSGLKLIVSAALLLAANTSATFATSEYLLQPGDSVHARILGIVGADANAVVAADGTLRLPLLGTLEAAGKTLDELTQAAKANMVEQRFVRTDADNNPRTTDLAGMPLFMQIHSYRPAYIMGDVLNPGRIPYSPGMKIRDAIALAGGPSFLPNDEVAVIQQVEARARRRELEVTLATLIAEDWMLRALLTEAVPQSEPLDAPVNAATFEPIMVAARQELDARLAAVQAGKESIATEMEELDQLARLYDSALEKARNSVDLNTEHADRVARLLQRGMSTTDTLMTAERLLANSNTDLVHYEVDRVRLIREAAVLQKSLEEEDHKRREGLVSELADIQHEISLTKAKIETTTLLGGAVTSAIGGSILSQDVVTIIVARNGKELVVNQDLKLDDELIPGDNLMLTFIQ